MTATQYSLSWDSHKTSICNGFTRLQQREEFVDMTLAAEGHLVKVHRNLIALASPYLREILKSAPCQHPVIFLSNINHEILCFILEYIYTGEVGIPSNKLQDFLKAAKALHLSGVQNLAFPQEPANDVTSTGTNDNIEVSNQPDNTSVPEQNTIPKIQFNIPNQQNIHLEIPPDRNDDDMDIETIINPSYINKKIDTNIQQFELDRITKIDDTSQGQFVDPACVVDTGTVLTNYNIDGNEGTTISTNHGIHTAQSTTTSTNQSVYPNQGVVLTNDSVSDTGGTNNVAEPTPLFNINISSTGHIEQTFTQPVNTENAFDVRDIGIKDVCTPQFTISNRGCLQLILNRYMYYVHHQSDFGRKRRWRCVNYRRQKCPAYLDTEDDNIKSRKFIHNHKFHDNKIAKQIKKNAFFTSLAQAEEKQISAVKMVDEVNVNLSDSDH